jgi:hypothetical protein
VVSEGVVGRGRRWRGTGLVGTGGVVGGRSCRGLDVVPCVACTLLEETRRDHPRIVGSG